MDTSKEFILMCEKAEEIQKLWKPQVGDIFYREDLRGIQSKRNGIKLLKQIGRASCRERV